MRERSISVNSTKTSAAVGTTVPSMMDENVRDILNSQRSQGRELAFERRRTNLTTET